MVLGGDTTLLAVLESAAWAALPVGAQLRARSGMLLATRVHGGSLLEPHAMRHAIALMPPNRRPAVVSEEMQ